MVLRHVAIEEAYTVLGLENGASSEEVKSTYKKLAMKTHPDKNPDEPDATQKFQEVGAAYNTLMKHFDRSESAPPRHRASWQSDDDDLEYDSEYYDDDEPEDLDFYIFIFDELLRGRSGGRSHFGYSTYLYAGTRLDAPETEEQYQERLHRKRQEQDAARQRRAMEEQRRKERLREEKERERLAAEVRQKQRISQKKAQLEASKQNAAQKIRSQQERTQLVRSAVFAAARHGDTEAVKKGVWEDSVDAAGGEVRCGSEVFVPQLPKDPAETLLHIAAGHGDVELVEWLVNHNAEADERNSAGLTALHLAMQKGYVPIVQYFFKNLPPKDSDYHAIYTTPASTDLLRLAIESFEPELVWMVLENKLANKGHIRDAWSWLCSDNSTQPVNGKRTSERRKTKDDANREEEIKNLLMAYGGLTPPPTPKTETRDITTDEKKVSNTRPKKPVMDPRMPASPVLQNPTPVASPVPSDHSYLNSPVLPVGASDYFNARGHARGRGRGRGKGYGRGRGRGNFTPGVQKSVS